MTEKELLYLEDATNHEKNLIEISNIIISNLENKNLQTFLNNQLKKHENLKEKLLAVMEDLTNE